jgi:hypothetical protein
MAVLLDEKTSVVPANAGTDTPRPIGETPASDIFVDNERRWLWVPAFAGTTKVTSRSEIEDGLFGEL